MASPSQQSTVLPLYALSVKTPRLDPYHRLLSRFYECVVLLKVLGQTRGEQVSSSMPNNDKATMRRFLRHLAYMCDFRKGGGTCTAVSLEETDTKYIFWVASNERSLQAESILRECLLGLSSISKGTSSTGKMTGNFSVDDCINFARPRIKKEISCLVRVINECVETLDNGRACSEDRDLAGWLRNLIHSGPIDDLSGVCDRMYRASKDFHVEVLRRRAASLAGTSDHIEKRSSLLQARHFIGRLAYRVRAFDQLIEDSALLDYIFLQYEVRAIPLMKAAPMPPPDSHTNLDGILNRMLPKGDTQRKDVENGLLHLDRCSGIFTQFMQQYLRCRPAVHAEVLVVEHFYANGLHFAGNDRYVACSKPSCFCCCLYFRHHPNRMVVPTESHQKVWPNWGLPKIENFSKVDIASIRQRDIMNKIIQQCREEIIFQVLERSSPSPWHPDSQTAISDVRLPFEKAVLQNTQQSDIESEEDYGSDEGGVPLV